MRIESRKTLLILLLFVALIFPPFTEAGGKGSGRKKGSGGYQSYRGAKAIDGDTFRHKGKRYRVRQYNAPELGTPGSSKATKKLQKKIDSGNYGWKGVARDTYGRKIVEEKRVE